MINLQEINLPKWPGCDVDGNPVTREQANEILVRTGPFWLSTNDKPFKEALDRVYHEEDPEIAVVFVVRNGEVTARPPEAIQSTIQPSPAIRCMRTGLPHTHHVLSRCPSSPTLSTT